MVITLEASRIARFTGSGSSAAPSSSALCAMARLVGAHRLDHRARALVLRRQRLEVAGEVLLDLALGFGEESEIPAVAEQRRRRRRWRTSPRTTAD